MKIVLNNIKGAVGEYCDGVARIDLSKDTHNPGSTAVHEMIHHLYPEMKEGDVLKWEKKIWKNLPYKIKIDIYKQLLRRRANLILKLVKERIG